MIERRDLLSGSYLRHFDQLPPGVRQTAAQLEASLNSTLGSRPAGANEFWLFAYGSLMWNPTLIFDERVQARLSGWERSFCMRLIAGRASVSVPGRMLSLVPGGYVNGIAYRIPSHALDEELPALWLREMVTGAYSPRWVSLNLADGRSRTALVFTADTSAMHWSSEAAPETVAHLIERASGPLGTNADYVRKLYLALNCEGYCDAYFSRVASLIFPDLGRPLLAESWRQC